MLHPRRVCSKGKMKEKIKRLICGAEIEEFEKKIQLKYYSIVNHLGKTPTPIFV